MTVEDTPGGWSLPAVVAWLIGCDYFVIKALCAPLPVSTINRGEAILQRSRHIILLAGDNAAGEKRTEAAGRKMLAKLAAGEWKAVGSLNDRDPKKHIPPVEIPEALTRLQFLESRIGPYRNVVINRVDVLRHDKEPVASSSETATPEQAAEEPQDPPRVTRTLGERAVNNWLDRRAKARPDRPWEGQSKMWQSVKDDLDGDISRARFFELREAAMKRHAIERPPAGSPGKRIAPVN